MTQRKKVQRHPATEARFREACRKWNHLHHQLDEARLMLMAGMVARHFDSDEIAMLREAGFLSQQDEWNLKRMRAVSKREPTR